MDADRFDALSRALTTAPSRRTTLGVLLGALLGKAVPGSSPEAAAARKGNGRGVHAAACIEPGARGCPKTACCATQCKKKKKKCLPCPAGTTYCASKTACVDSAQFATLCTDNATCDPPCTGGRVCNPSTGFCTCPDEKPVLCNGQCTDPRSDKNNCWPNFDSCGFPCPAGDGHVCCNGTCAFLPGCLAGSNMGDCQKQHCGTCGNPCTAEGSACCNGQCVANNDENCGYCGNNCKAQGLRCVGNSCVA